jgi:membrane-associated phospholipid phosphatase
MSPARRMLVVCAVFGIAFALEGAMVTLGLARSADQRVAALLNQSWNPSWLLPLEGIAVLGGAEVTFLLGVGIFIYLRRLGLRAESWAVMALPVASLVELVYKRIIFQPPPIAHGEGPSVDMLVTPAVTNSFPSGHMVRVVLAYGLLAFVIVRMSEQRWLRRGAAALAGLMIVVMVADRLLLAVHWESDVVGGVLLGGTALAAAVGWMEQPWRRPRG